MIGNGDLFIVLQEIDGLLLLHFLKRSKILRANIKSRPFIIWNCDVYHWKALYSNVMGLLLDFLISCWIGYYGSIFKSEKHE